MSTPRSWAKIEFPASLIDEKIRGYLKREYEAEFSEDGTLSDWLIGDITIEDGIFTLDDGEAAYGEFGDLEALLIDQEIPFDRQSGMDWDRPPTLRVYRPARGDMAMDLFFPLDPETDEPVVSVKAIREILDNDKAPANAIQAYLDDNFPAYPSLADFVKEA